MLGRVRKILRMASKIAAIDGDERILLKHIKEAFEIDPDDHIPDVEESDAEDDNTNDADERHGSHERESEERHNAKERKQGREPKKQFDHEHCQRILFTALRRARRNGLTPSGSLDSILNELRVLERYAGSSIYLLHPMEVNQLFHGVSLATYQTIQRLYVDRLGRSLRTVTQILHAITEQAGMPALTSEAIWAIGVYLDERRDDQIAVSVERSTNPWILTSLHLNDRVVLMDGSAQSLTIAMVIDNVNERVLSVRICSPNNQDVAHALAVYDASILHRTPAQFAPAGLSWILPNRLRVIVDRPPGLEVV